ncbi:MAG TPA: DUF58 domain-containing protein [Gaiellaceae bacterium]|jgi:hypothetical protein|nr:DUF58 domain-containing protein [Gaiellaceae bacterium]
MVDVAGSIGVVPLHPRLRLLGSSFGGHTSIRRGAGYDIAGSRPYQPGDHVHAIDWKASARMTAVRDDDEFIVRARYAEEMPRVVILCDRRPEMSLFPPDLPWLAKPVAVAWCVKLIAASAVHERALVGYLDYASHGDQGEPAGQPFWRAPRARPSGWRGDLVETILEYLDGGFDAPADNVERSLHFLALGDHGAMTSGSFLFVLSDFVEMPSPEAWGEAIGRGWDIVPVIVQDPVWEQSFPPLGGVAASFADVEERRFLTVRLSEREAAERRDAHERRLQGILGEFTDLGLDFVLVSAAEPVAISTAFLEWAEQRVLGAGRLR